MRDVLARVRADLRHEPTEKRVRAALGEETVVDTVRALVVWEPGRVVPTYAVPEQDVRGELLPAGAARRPDDADLAEHLILDFGAFDAWYEEDEPIVGHPRDPFHRIDIRRSSRRVLVELDGAVLAESTRAQLLFETGLPLRFYLPREDVAALQPSAKRTWCAYKGEASYWSPTVAGGLRPDLAWSYEDPLPDAAAITGLVAFFDERVDVTLDGERRERPRTHWSASDA